jgi:hypothetical protein
MSSGRVRSAVCLCCLYAAVAGAGEILILQPAPPESRPSDRAKEAAREVGEEAREYLRPSAEGTVDGTTVILRSAPPRESERLQQRARSYIAPGGAQARKDCVVTVGSQVGTIGEGAGAARSGSVLETGTSNVNSQAKCR